MNFIKIIVFNCLLFVLSPMQASNQSLKKQTGLEIMAMIKRVNLDRVRAIYGKPVQKKREVVEILEGAAGTLAMKSILYNNGDSDLYMPYPEKGGFIVLQFKQSTKTTTKRFDSYKNYEWSDGTFILKHKD